MSFKDSIKWKSVNEEFKTYENCNQNMIIAVSYTHLDVYKRQHYHYRAK